MAASEEPEVPKIEIDYVELITVMLDMLRATWPLWALIVGIGFVKHRMDGHTFERYLQTLFQRRGFRVQHVGANGGDYGGDLLIQKNGTLTLVQAKRYSKNVGVPVVAPSTAAPLALAGSDDVVCARCGDRVSMKVRDYCLAHPRRFGGLVYCYSHQNEFKRRR